MKAHVKQEEVINHNCWVKNIDRLVGDDDQLRESIEFGSTGGSFKSI